MVRLSEFEQSVRAEELLYDLRDAYRTLDVFGAVFQDRGNTESANRIFSVMRTIDDCIDFVEKSKGCCSEGSEITYERQENLNDNK